MADKMLIYTRLAPARVPKKRSRAGCVYCPDVKSSSKEKKKKCDETRPQCDRCVERDQPCVYEPIRPRQRRKRDSVNAAGHSSDEADVKNGESPEDDASLDGDILIKSEDSEDDGKLAGFTAPLSTTDAATTWRGLWQDSAGLTMSGTDLNPALPPSPGPSETMELPLISGPTVKRTMRIPYMPANVRRTHEEQDHRQRRQSYVVGTPPSDPPIYGPDTIVSTDTMGWQHVPTGSMLARRNTSYSKPTTKVAHLVTPAQVAAARRMSYSHPATVPSPSPILASAGQYSEFSTDYGNRVLLDHFDGVLSHLIVLGEDGFNPFRKLVLPLALKSQAVKSALYALASAHMEQCGRPPKGQQQPDYFHNSAILKLRKLLIPAAGPSENELLAAIMMVIYYEVLVQKHHSNMVSNHLKGALTVIGNRSDPLDETGQFLSRAFHFYDVITALSMGTRPLSPIPHPRSLASSPSPGTGVFSSFNNIDTLLGLSTTLWPTLHRLSALCELKERHRKNSLPDDNGVLHQLDRMSIDIETELLAWQPPAPASDTPRGRSLIDNALAYRHAALVHLYRAIDERPQNDTDVQHHACRGLDHCMAVVNFQGPTGALLWPLFVSSCEVLDPEKQLLAAWVFDVVERRQGMTNIQRARAVVQEVWRRRDGEGGDYGLWRAVCRDMELAIVFG